MNLRKKIVAVLLVIFSLGSAYVGGLSLFYLKAHNRFPFRSNNPNYEIKGITNYQESLNSYYWMIGIACLILILSIHTLWKLFAQENREV